MHKCITKDLNEEEKNKTLIDSIVEIKKDMLTKSPRPVAVLYCSCSTHKHPLIDK